MICNSNMPNNVYGTVIVLSFSKVKFARVHDIWLMLTYR